MLVYTWVHISTILAHVHIYIHTYAYRQYTCLTDNETYTCNIYIYIYTDYTYYMHICHKKNFLHQMYHITSFSKCVCQRYYRFVFSMFSTIECRHIDSDKTDHMIPISCIQQVFKVVSTYLYIYSVRLDSNTAIYGLPDTFRGMLIHKYKSVHVSYKSCKSVHAPYKHIWYNACFILRIFFSSYEWRHET